MTEILDTLNFLIAVIIKRVVKYKFYSKVAGPGRKLRKKIGEKSKSKNYIRDN
jgi:hypothetical protein